MAHPDKTVRVIGLPIDVEDERLTDKLLIFFLREKHGGGDIASIKIVKDPPGSALITFDDRRVAQRVIQHGRHILPIDGKQYKLTITEHCESLEPDKVILSMSVTIDCDQLLLRRTEVRALSKIYADIELNYDTSREVCTIRGPYSQVQAALAQLLQLQRSPKSAEATSTVEPSSFGCNAIHAVREARSPKSQLSKPYNGRKYTVQTYSNQASGNYGSAPHANLTTIGPEWEDTDRTKSGAMAARDLSILEEDLSLIMDADMFAYLQKHCGKEYQNILSHYGVEVVDVTSEGVTTLFLRCGIKTSETDNKLERLKLARSKITRLYQDNESKLCRVQVPKRDLFFMEGIQRVIERLRVRLPKLLLNEDDQNIYIIGSDSDSSEAQKALVDHSQPRRVAEDIATLPRSDSPDCDTLYPIEDGNTTIALPSLPTCLKTGTLLVRDKGESRAEGTIRYKPADQFKDPGLGDLGIWPGDSTTVGHPPPAVRIDHGAILGHDLFSETARLPFTGTPLITTQITPSGSITNPAIGTGSILSRDSSSSEISGPNVQTIRQFDDEGRPGGAQCTVGDRANSFSYQREKGRREIKFSNTIWQYIKKVYWPRLEDLSADIQMEERHPDANDDLTIILTALDSSKVSACQRGLQKLLAKVSVDFCVCNLSLIELGVSDPTDETLNVCCAEVRRKFKKVSIQISTECIFILGPKHLCSHVANALMEVFPGVSADIPKQQNLTRASISNLNHAIPTKTSKDPHLGPFERNCAQQKQVHREMTGICSSKRTDQSFEVLNATVSQPLYLKEPVMKEKVISAGTMHLDTKKTVRQSIKRNDSGMKPLADSGTKANDIGQELATFQKEINTDCKLVQKDNKRRGWSEESSTCHNPGRSGQQGIDICLSCMGKASAKAVCPECMVRQHVRYRVWPKAERKGIHGNISYSVLSFSLLGHNNDSTLKITYSIPDGIQEEGHPSPGSPFQGSVFEAYLPFCQRVEKLLPRLDKAFKQGLTFTVHEKKGEAKVTWYCIPHKTQLEGGKSLNGYPDSGYLTRLSEILNFHGIP